MTIDKQYSCYYLHITHIVIPMTKSEKISNFFSYIASSFNNQHHHGQYTNHNNRNYTLNDRYKPILVIYLLVLFLATELQRQMNAIGTTLVKYHSSLYNERLLFDNDAADWEDNQYF